MASYLRSWFPEPVASAPSTSHLSDPNTILSFSPPEDDDDDVTAKGDSDDEDLDMPAAFPAPFSAQRIQTPQSNSGVPRILTDNASMPPPPNPSLARRGGAGGLAVPSNSGSLMPPPTTLKAQTKLSSSSKRAKVALAPGHSPLDWASLKSSGADLRGGVEQLMKIPPSVLKQHNKRDDAWSALNGKVYNITPYLAFHPGGEKELMRVAGRDGTKLFALTHAWVNADFMLDACLVGFLVPEPRS